MRNFSQVLASLESDLVEAMSYFYSVFFLKNIFIIIILPSILFSIFFFNRLLLDSAMDAAHAYQLQQTQKIPFVRIILLLLKLKYEHI